MIYHNVSFKLKKDVSASDEQNMIDALNALNDSIDEIEFLAAAKNFSDRSQGYDIHLVSSFKTKNALDTYQKHPAHVNTVEKYVKPFIESLIVGDIQA